jgi:hypothetical protein
LVNTKTHSHCFSWVDVGVLTYYYYFYVFKLSFLIGIEYLFSGRKADIACEIVFFFDVMIEHLEIILGCDMFQWLFPVAEGVQEGVQSGQAVVVKLLVT